MLSSTNRQALDLVRGYLDDAGFAYMSYRLIPGHDSIIWPDFPVLHATLAQMSDTYRLLFTLLRQGHAAEERVLEQALPGEILDAFKACGLLEEASPGLWRTPGLALLPVEGLLLAVSLPPHYPTAASPKQPVYIGPESLWLTRALPPRLAGSSVLDLCAGSGIQGLLCAARGAALVVALELHPQAVAAARFNAALNGLQGVVEVRASDLGAALREAERFDLVVCNPPFMPVMEDVDYPLCGAGGVDGTRLLRRIVAGLPLWLAPGGEAVLFCNVLGGPTSVHFNDAVLEALARSHDLFIRAYVDDKHPWSEYVEATLLPNLRTTCPELSAVEREGRIAAWEAELKRRSIPADFIYGQILRVWQGRSPGGLVILPAYDPISTDPLLARARMARHRA